MKTKYAKLVVKDANGNIIQLLPETKVDLALDGSSDYPVSNSAVVSALANVNLSDPIALTGSQINPNSGSVFTKTIMTNTTFTIVTIPQGKATRFELILTKGGSKTITWPSSIKWAGGTEPALSETGVDVLTFITPNGGTVWYGSLTVAGAA